MFSFLDDLFGNLRDCYIKLVLFSLILLCLGFVIFPCWTKEEGLSGLQDVTYHGLAEPSVVLLLYRCEHMAVGFGFH
jgi:hypothetical protein